MTEIREQYESEEVIRSGKELSFKKTKKALAKAVKNKETMIIAGREITDPTAALARLESVELLLKNIKVYYPDAPIEIRKNDIYFQKFEHDEAMGEATDNKVFLDSIILMHPIERILHLVLHESLHKQGNVPNDALIEGYLKTCGIISDGLEVTEEYKTAQEKFYLLMQRMTAEGEDLKDTVIFVSQLYFNEKYSDIYKLYLDKTIGKTFTEETDLFWDVFPELDVYGDREGFVDNKPVTIPETANLVESARKNVDDTFKGFNGS